MKPILLMFVITTLFAGQTMAHNNGNHKLTDEVNLLIQQNEQLKKRMARMENILKDLRRDIRSINQAPQLPVKSRYTCLLSTRSHGAKSFLGKGPTKVEAKAKASAKCEQEVFGSYCRADKATFECEAEVI